MTSFNPHQPDTRLWANLVKTLKPYVPGEQPKHKNLCKLNTNENPFPPSPKVSHAIQAELFNQAENLRLYPAPESDDLRIEIAKYYGLDSHQIFVGNGSDEVLAHIFACFFVKNLPVLTPDIGYSFYPVYADTFGVNLQKIALKQDFSININDYQKPCAGIIFANPNAPTGILLNLTEIEKLLQKNPDVVIVIDEAYIDFSDQANSSAVSLINNYDNLIITQTFSKSRSLAGLRVGMAFANPSLIEALNRYKNCFNSYPIDRLAQVGAIASLQDKNYFTECCEKIIQLRQSLTQDLEKLDFEILPSQANFLFVKPPIKFGHAKELFEKFREQGVIVRHFSQDRITDFLRISIGNQDQNNRLLEVLNSLC